jgi:thiol-disulfide isomerase/thioredoxin
LIAGPEMVYTKVGENAPDFSVRTRQGNVFRRDDRRGKVVVVHFWGPSCAPCIHAMPRLIAWHRELAHRSDRIAMIELTCTLEDKVWREFLDGQGMDRLQALLTGENLRVWDGFRVRGIPDFAVIGPDGKINADGESTGRDVEKLKAAILKAMGQ